MLAACTAIFCTASLNSSPVLRASLVHMLNKELKFTKNLKTKHTCETCCDTVLTHETRKHPLNYAS